MKKSLFLALILMFWTLSFPVFSKEYSNEKTGLNFTAPQKWTIQKQTNHRYVPVVHEDKIGTINVSIHYFSDPITANGLQRMRVASRYDGWVNLFERPGTAFESARANMDESHIAVYTKKLLDSSLSVRTKLAAEYYFVKDQIGAIVTIDTFSNHWPSIQKDIKHFLETFWVGTGKRPPISTPDQATLGWEMGGKQANNLNYAEKYGLPPTPNVNWTIFYDKQSADTPHLHPNNVVTTEQYIVIYDNQSISCHALQSGKKLWTYPTSRVDHHLVMNATTLFLVHGESKKTLTALSLQSGNLLYKRPIDHDVVSELVYSQQHLFFYTPRQLTAINATTGETIWTADGTFDPSYYPISNQTLVVVAETEKKLLAYEKQTGNLSWIRELDDALLVTPTIDNAYLYVSLGKHESFKLHERPIGIIQCLDLQQAGKKLWSFTGLDIANQLVSPLTVSDTRVGAIFRIQPGSLFESELYVPVPNLDLLVCMDRNTGEKLWTKQLFSEVGSAALPIFSSVTDIFVDAKHQGQPIVDAIRAHSGRPFLRFQPQSFLLEGFNYSFMYPVSSSKILMIGNSDSQSSIQLLTQVSAPNP